MKNFIKLNENESLKEIFLLIFPELKYLERLNQLKKIINYSNFSKKILLAVLVVDEKNNHEYFSHKYNISNNLKENLNLVARNFNNFVEDKNFFEKDLKKNVFYFGKEHLRILNIINFSYDKKIKLDDYLNIFNKVNKLSLPKFPFDGNYLKNKGIKEGAAMGKVLKLLENDWIENSFNISEERISKIINEHRN